MHINLCHVTEAKFGLFAIIATMSKYTE